MSGVGVVVPIKSAIKWFFRLTFLLGFIPLNIYFLIFNTSTFASFWENIWNSTSGYGMIVTLIYIVLGFGSWFK